MNATAKIIDFAAHQDRPRKERPQPLLRRLTPAMGTLIRLDILMERK